MPRQGEFWGGNGSVIRRQIDRRVSACDSHGLEVRHVECQYLQPMHLRRRGDRGIGRILLDPRRSGRGEQQAGLEGNVGVDG